MTEKRDLVFITLCEMLTNASNMLRGNKKAFDHQFKKRYHGQKKAFVRYLYQHYPCVQCQQILQLNPNIKGVKPHYLLKFQFNIAGEFFDFHTPLVQVDWFYKLTTEDIGTITIMEAKPSYGSLDHVKDLINIVGLVSSLNSEKFKDQAWAKIENFVTNYELKNKHDEKEACRVETVD